MFIFVQNLRTQWNTLPHTQLRLLHTVSKIQESAETYNKFLHEFEILLFGVCMKYCNVLKWEGRLTLVLNAVKNTNYLKKASSKSCWEFNFLQKTL